MHNHGLARWAILAALATEALANPLRWPFRNKARDEPEPPKATTITAADGQVLVSSSSVVVVGETQTVSLVTVPSSQFITHGVTFTLSPPGAPTDGPVAPTPEEPNEPTPEEPEQPEEPNPEEPNPEQPNPEQPNPEEPNPEEPNPEQPNPEQPNPEQPNPEQPNPEQPNPEQPNPEEPNPEQPNPEQPNPEEPNPEQPNPEQPNPEQPNPEQPEEPEVPEPEQPEEPEVPEPEVPEPEVPEPEVPEPEVPEPEVPEPEQPEEPEVPEPEVPEPEVPEPEVPEPEVPEPEVPEPEVPEPEVPEPEVPEPEVPEPEVPEPEVPEPEQPDVPEPEVPEPEVPEPEEPQPEEPEPEQPDPEDPEDPEDDDDPTLPPIVPIPQPPTPPDTPEPPNPDQPEPEEPEPEEPEPEEPEPEEPEPEEPEPEEPEPEEPEPEEPEPEEPEPEEPEPEDPEDPEDDDDPIVPPIIPIPPPPTPPDTPEPPNPDQPEPDEPEPEEPEPEEPEPEEPEPEEPDEPEPSCTTTIEATWASVFCTVTGTATNDPDCTTESFTTTASCSQPTASDVTTTTTIPTATPTNFCSPETCGGGSCAAPQKRDEAGLAKRTVPRKPGQPGECEWAGPDDYEDPGQFMNSEGGLGVSNADAADAQSVSIVPLLLTGDKYGNPTTSKMVNFADKPVSLAIPRLSGCTSIIVVSKKGVWANHIWERATFTPDKEEVVREGGDPDDPDDWVETGNFLSPKNGDVIADGSFPAELQRQHFQRHAIDTLYNRYEGDSTNHATGLKNLVKEGNPFAPSEEPQVYMFAPMVRVTDLNSPNFGNSGSGLPYMWDTQTGQHPDPHHLRADVGDGQRAFNDQLRTALKDIVKDTEGQGVTVNMIPYAPVTGYLEEMGEDEALIAENDMLDWDYENPRGRGLIQFRPGNNDDCEAEAAWRMFFERETEPSHEKSWSPHDDQRCTAGGNTNERKIKRQECSLTAPFPTLTQPPATEMPTITGSSCASTATITRCNMGACIDIPSCADWVATSTEEAGPPTTTVPNIENERDCNEESDFPGHADLQHNAAWWGAISACAQAPEYMGTYSARGPPYRLRTTDQYDVNYDWQISWAYGCFTDSNEVETLYPMGEDERNCYEILYDNFDKCHENGGVGGVTRVGCLEYRFDGGRG